MQVDWLVFHAVVLYSYVCRSVESLVHYVCVIVTGFVKTQHGFCTSKFSTFEDS